MGDTCMGWMLLWRASIAAPRLMEAAGSLDPSARQKAAAKSKEAAFYEGQIQSATYFINAILPIALGRMAAIRSVDPAVVQMPEAGFGG
jgi:hypothetical protein